MENEDVGRIFTVLGHELRREVIRILAEKGPKSFTELMEELDLRDTGALVFHLRKLAGLVRKNSRGDCELSEEGLKAYRLILAAMSGEPLVQARASEEKARESSAPVAEGPRASGGQGELPSPRSRIS